MSSESLSSNLKKALFRVPLYGSLAAIDKHAVEVFGIAGTTLMKQAGEGITRHVLKWLAQQGFSPARQPKIQVYCGPGNNGGDGLVCARILWQIGYQNLQVVSLAHLSDYQGDAGFHAKQLLTDCPTLPCLTVSQDLINCPDWRQEQLSARLWIDALFGTGLNRPLEGLPAQLIESLNALSTTTPKPPYRFAIDVPSGIHPKTGAILGVAFKSDETITLAAEKLGLYLPPAKAFAQPVTYVDIGIPDSVFLNTKEAPFAWKLTNSWAKATLPERSSLNHKYQFGHVLIVAGSVKMPGAAVLAAKSCLKSGVGMVTLAAPQSLFEHIDIPCEIVRLPLPECPTGTLCPDSFTMLKNKIDNTAFDVVLTGPGIGLSQATQSFFDDWFPFLQSRQQPWVLDADALTLLANLKQNHPDQFFEKFEKRGQHGFSFGILTPHSGEARRLLHLKDDEKLSTDWVQSATTLADAYEAIAVLKDATCLIAAPQTIDSELESEPESELPCISPLGNHGMATAGSGDVLVGLISGLYAQLIKSSDTFSMAPNALTPDTKAMRAACLGVYLHGLAGDITSQTLTPYAMSAEDIILAIPQAFKKLDNTN